MTGVKSTDLTPSTLRRAKLRGSPDRRGGVFRLRAFDGGSTLRFGRRVRGSPEGAKMPQVVTMDDIIDQSAVTFAPQVDVQFVVLGLIDQAPVIFAPQVNQKVTLDLIDNSAVTYAFAIVGAPAVTLTLIDQSATTFAPQLNTSNVVLSLLDQSAVAFPPQVNMKVTLTGLIDQSATTFDPSVGDFLQMDFIDQSAEVFDIEVTQGFGDVTAPHIDQSAVTFEPVVALGQPRTVELTLLDQEPVLFGLSVRIKTKGMIAKVGVYDPTIEKAGRYVPTIRKRGNFVS